jgi:uncharacterized membrane protein (UPF0136 family)
MKTLIALVGGFLCGVLFGIAGWLLYRNPVRILDIFYRPFDFQYGRFTLSFFRSLGAVMVVMAVLDLILILTVAVFWILH